VMGDARRFQNFLSHFAPCRSRNRGDNRLGTGLFHRPFWAR
jgi:hypothetical protein